MVDARPLSRQGGNRVKAEIRNPSGALTDCLVKDKNDGTYIIEYTPYENGNALSIMTHLASRLDQPQPFAPSASKNGHLPKNLTGGIEMVRHQTSAFTSFSTLPTAACLVSRLVWPDFFSPSSGDS